MILVICIDICWYLLICIDICWYALVSVDMHWYLFKFEHICWYVLIYVDMYCYLLICMTQRFSWLFQRLALSFWGPCSALSHSFHIVRTHLRATGPTQSICARKFADICLVVLVGISPFCSIVIDLVRFSFIFVSIYWCLWIFPDICIDICWHSLICIDIRWYLLICIRMC